MSSRELRASLSLASIFGLRLFGMFIILPVFALHARGLPGWDLTLIGIALGAYGLTQAVLQVPFGWLSDRHGRKPVLYFGLVVFALGSFACAWAEAPWAVIGGRAPPGPGGRFPGVVAPTPERPRASPPPQAVAVLGSPTAAGVAA